MPEPSTEERAAPRLIVAIGASAGGITALKSVLHGIPGDFPGALCVVMHLAPDRPSYLTAILDREAALPVVTAQHNQLLGPGQVYVAPPGRNLVLHDGAIQLPLVVRGNRHRTTIDDLFRSAALTLGPAAIGVVLSGTLADGSAGLREIKARGGRAVVQRPDDADYPGMPLAALDAIHPDLVGTATEIGEWLARQPPTTPLRGAA